MKSMGWRFVAVADLGLERKDAVRVPAGGPSEIRAALGVPEGRAEAAILGLAFLMRHAGEAVRVDVLSSDPEDLGARFREAVFEPEVREFRNPPLGLVLLDFDFSHHAGDLGRLQEMAEMARVAQAPVVAAASPAFFGLREWTLLAKLPDLPQRLADPAHASWQRFQKTEEARWVVLTANRWLLRPPAEGKTDDLLWGRGVWLVGAAVARSAATRGHALDLSGPRAGGFSGVPTRPYLKTANRAVPLPTEVELPDLAAQELSRGGFTPVSGRTGGDTVMIPLAVNAHRDVPGRLTVSGTLAYQLTAARLAQFCALLMDELPGTPGEAVEYLRRSLVEFLGPLAGTSPDAAVSVAPVEGQDAEGRPVRQAEISVRPDARIEGMDLRFTFRMPLR